MRSLKIVNGWLLRSILFAVLIIMIALPAAAATDLEGAKEAIIEGTWAEEKKIDLEEYQVPTTKIRELYLELAYSGQIPWWANDSYTYWYRGAYVTQIAPKYFSEDEYDRELYDAVLDQIIEETVHADMTDWQAALAVYDYLATNYCYDQSLQLHEGYDLLVGGTAVCEGYAKAYMSLMQKLGIPCVMSLSDPMYHVWNMVKIGGEWYHVDVTWGDPTPDVNGRVDHGYFLISDATISDAQHGHYGWHAMHECADPMYETGVYWEDLESAVCYPGANTSVLRREDGTVFEIRLRDEMTGSETVLWSVDEGYIDIGTGTRYNYNNYGLSLWDGYLYFSDMEQVYRMSVSGGEAEVVFRYDAIGNGRVILGSHIIQDMLYVTTRNHAGDKEYMAVSLANHAVTRFQSQEESAAFSASIMVGGEEDQTVQWLPYSPFFDVTTSDFYYDASIWAYENEITNGYYKNYLNPNGECSRAMLVTYIWRAMGCPEPVSNQCPFVDVTEQDYFYKAVLWAVEQGITTGVDATHFDPHTTCNRAHMVTFLWRTDGIPNPAGMTTDFVDVPADSYFYKSVLWAIDRKITNGVDATHFAPYNTCTIGHAVTFLYRLLG